MIEFLIRRFVPDWQQVQRTDVRERYGTLAAAVGILSNIFLCIIKGLIGLFSGSIAVTADAVNNLSDAGSSVITLLAFKIAGKPADEEHPYGHARMEYISGMAVSFIIILLGLELMGSSFEKILHPEEVGVSALTYLVLIVSIAVKLWQGMFNRNLGKRISSEALLKNGGEIFRVQQTMQLVAKAYGIPGFQVYVLANGLFVSMQEEGRTITRPVESGDAAGQEHLFGQEHLASRAHLASQVRYVPLSSVHLGRVAAVNNLSREIVAQKYTVEEASRKIEQIDKLPFTSNAVQTLMSGLGAGAFCILFGGSLLDSAAAFLSGLVLWIFVLFLTARGANKIMVNILASALVTAMGVLFFHLFSFGDSMDMIVIGSIVPLLPGVPLTNSIRDYLNGDYLSGTIRMIDAVLVACCIALGVGIVLRVFQLVTA